MVDFKSFFAEALGSAASSAPSPYPYQERLANCPIASRGLRVATGAGKTAAAMLSWLYRLQRREPDAPTRLVFCLPMRVLVEQTERLARTWTARVAPDVQVATLMGGDVDDSWELQPDRPWVLVGTQDMLLSRALNRGYAMSRHRWPVHFGLLNSDCYWVFDEVQLMGDGLATSTQLDGLRASLGVFGACPTLWMSATMDSAMLESVSARRDLDLITLDQADLERDSLRRGIAAVKRVARADEACWRPAGLAQFLAERHRPGMQTVAIVNRVDRARETFEAFRKLAPQIPSVLMHSRFRPAERRSWKGVLEGNLPDAGRVVISTQVLEAGVDITSAVMVTDIAPWPSLVQRFGRCNRAGELGDTGGDIFWVDRPMTSKQKADDGDEISEETARPYDAEELRIAEGRIADVQSASPVDLPKFETLYRPNHVLRRRDVIDLFDTTADLSGYDVDVSRFIRDEKDRDVQVAWRDARPLSKDEAPAREELCAAPVGEVLELIKREKGKGEIVAWSYLEERWTQAESRTLRPGMVLVATTGWGRYDIERGWDKASEKAVTPVSATMLSEDGSGGDRWSFLKYRQGLSAHSREVVRKMEGLLDSIQRFMPGVGEFRDDLLESALYHDWGKAHPVFQKTVNPGGGPALAKTTGSGRHERPHFRHELASALAMLQTGAADLAVYLAAAHHGKVRLSIRSMPGESRPPRREAKFARGIHDGDVLPTTRLDGIETPEVSLDLEPMLLGLSAQGSPSWVDRMTGLRDSVGLFRLAYLEALIVAADCQASAEPVEVLP